MESYEMAQPQDWKNHKESMGGKIIDVRSASEYADSYIEGALNIDVMLPDFADNLNALNKTSNYFIYCSNGARANTAMVIMKKKGFNHVFNLEGGLMQWQLKGFLVEYGEDF